MLFPICGGPLPGCMCPPPNPKPIVLTGSVLGGPAVIGMNMLGAPAFSVVLPARVCGLDAVRAFLAGSGGGDGEETRVTGESVSHGPARLVVLISGSGTNLQALLDACADPAYGAEVVAVGADRDGIAGLARAERADVPTFVRRVADAPDRDTWDRELAEVVATHDPDLVVSAGFMKLAGRHFLE